MPRWNSGQIAVALIVVLFGTRSSTAAPIFFTDETLFNSATSGVVFGLESFESDFVDGTPSVVFPDVTVTGDENLIRTNPSTLATDGTGTIGIIDFGFGGNFVTFAFDSPVNAVSLDILAPLDVSSIGSLSLSNDNGASQVLFVAPLPPFSTQFAGIVDDMSSFNSITIASSQTGDGIQFDRLRFGVIPPGPGPGPGPGPVPEPTFLLLLGMGLAAVAYRRRRTP